MAFKLKTIESFKQKVDLDIPQDFGKSISASYVAEFKLLSRERIEEVTEQLTTGSLTESELLKEVLIGFEDVQDEDGQPLEFTDVNRNRFLNVQYVHAGTMKAFLKTFESKQSRRKN